MDGSEGADGTPLWLIRLGCLGLTAAISALGKGMELSVSDGEYEVVTQAAENADR
jgi:hypothetical protein